MLKSVGLFLFLVFLAAQAQAKLVTVDAVGWPHPQNEKALVVAAFLFHEPKASENLVAIKSPVSAVEFYEPAPDIVRGVKLRALPVPVAELAQGGLFHIVLKDVAASALQAKQIRLTFIYSNKEEQEITFNLLPRRPTEEEHIKRRKAAFDKRAKEVASVAVVNQTPPLVIPSPVKKQPAVVPGTTIALPEAPIAPPEEPGWKEKISAWWQKIKASLGF